MRSRVLNETPHAHVAGGGSITASNAAVSGRDRSHDAWHPSIRHRTEFQHPMAVWLFWRIPQATSSSVPVTDTFSPHPSAHLRQSDLRASETSDTASPRETVLAAALPMFAVGECPRDQTGTRIIRIGLIRPVARDQNPRRQPVVESPRVAECDVPFPEPASASFFYKSTQSPSR